MLDHRPKTEDHRPVVVTFDDGLEDNYTCAFPILKEMGVTAYFFILGSKVGAEGYMNWKQIIELKENGMVIGSHGMKHRILTRLSDEDLDYELRTSKTILEYNIKVTVDYLSIPRGFCNKKVVEKAREVGYRAVFTSDAKDSDDFRFGRIPVRARWDISHFIRVLDGEISVRDKAEDAIKYSAKRILGATKYDKLRTRLLKK
jgi:peptidoglycan/xylan/chitin deacetylase (PgdA/CDA1 family)